MLTKEQTIEELNKRIDDALFIIKMQHEEIERLDKIINALLKKLSQQ